MPASRNSFTRRSCNVRWARSTRPLAAGVLAQIPSMFSHKHQRRAHRPPVLKPGMLTPIDLDELPDTRPPRARLLDLGGLNLRGLRNPAAI